MDSSPDRYRPVSCSLHDRLEAAAVRRELVRVDFVSPGGASHVTEGTIRDIVTREGAEYLLMASGFEIRLDRVTALSPRPSPPGT